MGNFKALMLATATLLEVGNFSNFKLTIENYLARILPNNIEMYNDEELMFADNQLTK